jgi:hypothetical protein
MFQILALLGIVFVNSFRQPLPRLGAGTRKFPNCLHLRAVEPTSNLPDPFEKIMKKLEDIESDLNSLRSDVGSLRFDVGELKGESTERYIRNCLQKLQGEPFCDPFVIQGLAGIARLIQPSKKSLEGYFPEPLEKAIKNFGRTFSDFSRQQEVIVALIYYIKKHQGAETLLAFFLQTHTNAGMDPSLRDISLYHGKIFSGSNSEFSGSTSNSDKVSPPRPIEEPRSLSEKFWHFVQYGPEALPAATADMQPKTSVSSFELEKQRIGIFQPLFRYTDDVGFRQFLKFVIANSTEQQRILESDNTVGMMLFSAVACGSSFQVNGSTNQQWSPSHEVDLDVRGLFSASIFDRNCVSISITVGEIKYSEKGVGTARTQLSTALSILEHASRAYYGDYLQYKIEQIVKTGWICLPKKAAAVAKSQPQTPEDFILMIKGY